MGNPFKVNAPINNAMLDPIQGYNADVFVLDQATGKYILIGRFVSIQLMIRNSTEPYLTLNQRMPRYLDGEMSISWQMERGQLDARILQQTFGFDRMTPGDFIDKMPRFQISFVLDDKSLTHDVPTPAGVSNDGTAEASPWSRKGQGEMVLTFCKVDNLTIAATSGRSVVANRWEGLAEGIQYVNRTDPIQDQSILDTTYAGNLNGALLQSTDFQPFAWGTATGTNPINNA